MFNPNAAVIDHFVEHCLARYREAYPEPGQRRDEALERAARTALETLLGCDCSYHDLDHTIMVTDAGQTILQGRLLAFGDLSPDDWLQAVIAMLLHDVGYIRGLLRDDRPGSYVADAAGNRVAPPEGATDAYLMPYHVTRGCLYVHERFGDDPVIDAATVAEHIEMTRFPVPAEAHYQRTDSISALVRAADLIGQMADPLYVQKISRLYAEFVETGEAGRLGYDNANALRADFPDFFYEQVYPYVTDALSHLRRTQDGQQWLANLQRHLHSSGEAETVWGPERDWTALPSGDGARRRGGPRIAISNR
jgi:hypothetical protein